MKKQKVDQESLEIWATPKSVQFQKKTRLTIKSKLAQAEVRRCENLQNKVNKATDSYMKHFVPVKPRQTKEKEQKAFVESDNAWIIRNE